MVVFLGVQYILHKRFLSQELGVVGTSDRSLLKKKIKELRSQLDKERKAQEKELRAREKLQRKADKAKRK